MTYNILSNQYKNMNTNNHPLKDFYLLEKTDEANIRVPLFGNMLFDKLQIIVNYKMDDKGVQDLLTEMGDFNYSDIGLFFIPNELIPNNPLIAQIRSYVDNFKQGVDPEICSENIIFFAERKTKDGLFLCMNDDSVLFLQWLDDQNAFYALNESPPEEVYSGGVIYFENCDEASGEDFFSYFHRENPIAFQRLKDLGAFDDECFFWED